VQHGAQAPQARWAVMVTVSRVLRLNGSFTQSADPSHHVDFTAQRGLTLRNLQEVDYRFLIVRNPLTGQME